MTPAEMKALVQALRAGALYAQQNFHGATIPDPSRILTLCDEVDRLQGEVEMLKKQVTSLDDALTHCGQALRGSYDARPE